MEKRKTNERFGKSVLRTVIEEAPGSHELAEKFLSPREREVVVLLAEGNTNKQIAASLNLSARTVEAYRANVTRKLLLRSFPELVRYAVRNGVVKPQVSDKSTSGNVERDTPGVSLHILSKADEFKDLQASFQAIQKRFENAKASQEKQKLLATSQEIVLKAHLLISESGQKQLPKTSKKLSALYPCLTKRGNRQVSDSELLLPGCRRFCLEITISAFTAQN